MSADGTAGVPEVIVVGSGPAGYTAALYAARARLQPIVVEGFAWGGQLQLTSEVENYPGYPQGVSGPALMRDLRTQAERFGARFVASDATRIDPGSDGEPHAVWVGDERYAAAAVILAMGAEHKRLGVPGEAELGGRGISYCATCDAAFYEDVEAIVVGGGDSAMEEALVLAKYASRVTLVHRRDEFRASRIMLERVREHPRIALLTPYVVESFVASGDGRALQSARVRHVVTGTPSELSMRGAFVAIGHEPQSALVADFLPTDADGYVVTEAGTTRTAVPGVFAAGDLVDRSYRQAVTAAGSGCMAAIDAERYLRSQPTALVETGVESRSAV